jgi:large subunit ribosomal protein L29
MKKEEIKSFGVDELKAKIAEEKASLDKLKFANSISNIENPMQIRVTRKNIARMSTELTAKQKAK